MGPMGRLGDDLYVGRRSLRVVQRRRIFYTVAGVAVIASAVLLVRPGLTPGIEFSGGSEFTVSGASSDDTLLGQEAVDSVVADGQARVSQVGTDSIRVQTEQLGEGETQEVAGALAEAYGVATTEITSSFVGPSWGADITRQAIIGLLAFLLLVTVVLAVYFRTWTMAAAALAALVHDLVVTAGIYALVGFEVTPASVIGFLTIFGFSLYDTVVVFDKVRENTAHVLASTRRSFAQEAELALNQTVVRSLNTTVVSVLPVASILFVGALLLGAGTLKDLSLALMVGILAGTYSSIFLATPLLVDLRMRDPEMRAQAERVQRRHAGETAVVPEPVAVGAGQAPAGSDREDSTPAVRQQPRRGSRQRPSGKRR